MKLTPRFASIALALTFTACAHGPTSSGAGGVKPKIVDEPPVAVAHPSIAEFKAVKGSKVKGTLLITEENREVHVVGKFSGLKRNSKHGLHVHENGSCELPKFASAGDHWNPQKTEHGGVDSNPRHPGDLGNVTADSKGDASIDIRFPSGAGVETFGGKSIVLHAKMDDVKTQPSGDSGDRIACALVTEKAP